MSRPPEAPDDIYPGTVHSSNNYGDFEIVEYVNNKNVTVRFVATGFVVVSEAGTIRLGKVKDKLHPSVQGVGFIGGDKHTAKVGGKDTNAYTAWRNMVGRCYDPKTQERKPTYKGCTVAPEWHNFQNFAEWFEQNYIEGHELDKDIKIKGNKVYGPETCMFVSHKANNIEARAKHYKFINPDGKTVEIYNLSGFCRENNLNRGNMSRVHGGNQFSHKGWVSG